jgi:hypothetical protein
MEKVFNHKSFKYLVWKLVGDTSDTGGKYRWCHLHQWCTLTCEYLSEFLKTFEMTRMIFSEACGKMGHEKNLKQKIS